MIHVGHHVVNFDGIHHEHVTYQWYKKLRRPEAGAYENNLFLFIYENKYFYSQEPCKFHICKWYM